ncbi:hypothetical protein EON65_39065 [archaeon]|nr:MAG: hypothetical protein EON65_39065 [archaeon]
MAGSVSYCKTNELCSTLTHTLPIAAKRKIPAIFANADFSVKTDSRLAYMPGLVESYRTLGGEVIAYGKPHGAFFQAAIRIAFSLAEDAPIDPASLRRVAHVGESLHHDVGVRGIGVDSILITEHGVHSQNL